jgi:hypothetical protein
MPLDEYTFKLGDAGLILNDSATTPFVDITRTVGFDSAMARETEREWEGNDGGFMDAEFEKARRIILEGLAYADIDALEMYLDDLKENWAVSRTLVPLYFKAPGVVERTFLVKPLGMRYDWETTRRYGEARVQFLAYAEDPRTYSAEELTVPILINSVSTTGFGFPLGFPFGFGTSSSGLGTNLYNYGNRPTPVVFNIYGPTINPRIVNDDTGEEMEFLITLGTDQTLVVDTKYKTVRLDGAYNRRSTMVNAGWFFLKKGDNHIRYLADIATSQYVDAVYRSAWR